MTTRAAARPRPAPEIFEIARALARQLAREDYERARAADSARAAAVPPESENVAP